MDIRIDIKEDKDFRVERFSYQSDSISIEMKGNFDLITLDMTYEQVQSLLHTFKSVGLIK